MWYRSVSVCARFRWETIILISMYGVYIIIMKWVFPRLLTFPPSWWRDCLDCAVLPAGSTHPSTAWWWATAAGRVSRVWAACDAPQPSGVWASVTTTWCRWSQVQQSSRVVRLRQENKEFKQTYWHSSLSLPRDDFQQPKVELEHFDWQFLHQCVLSASSERQHATSLCCTFLCCYSPSVSFQTRPWWPDRTRGWWWWTRSSSCTRTSSPSQRQASAVSSPHISRSSVRYTARAHILHIMLPWLHLLARWVFKSTRGAF